MCVVEYLISIIAVPHLIGNRFCTPIIQFNVCYAIWIETVYLFYEKRAVMGLLKVICIQKLVDI